MALHTIEQACPEFPRLCSYALHDPRVPGIPSGMPFKYTLDEKPIQQFEQDLIGKSILYSLARV
jgi:hypothetical protein